MVLTLRRLAALAGLLAAIAAGPAARVAGQVDLLAAVEASGTTGSPGAVARPFAPRAAALSASAGLDEATVAVLDADVAPGFEQRRGQAALAMIPYPWQDLGFTVEFVPGRRGYLGLTFPDRRAIQVFVRAEHTVDQVAHVVAHELGHAIDLTHGTPERRAAFLAARGLPASQGWFTCDACTDYSTGAGDFAESFAAWATGAEHWRGQLAGPPADAQLAAIAPLFRP